jgi:BlaI family transcriptional regulator, penicillinase repressor
MPDAPSYSAVRTMLRILEDNAYARRQEDGPRYVRTPKVPPRRQAQSTVFLE